MPGQPHMHPAGRCIAGGGMVMVGDCTAGECRPTNGSVSPQPSNKPASAVHTKSGTVHKKSRNMLSPSC